MKDDFVGVIKQVAAFLDKEVNNVFLDELAYLFSSSSKFSFEGDLKGPIQKLKKSIKTRPKDTSVNDIYTFIHHGHCLGQIEEAAVEKLVAFLDINAMRENPMVRVRL